MAIEPPANTNADAKSDSNDYTRSNILYNTQTHTHSVVFVVDMAEH